MKLFGLILTFNCERFIEKTLRQIPKNKFAKIICSDDGSSDNTKRKIIENNIEFLSHEHFGYGGNLLFGLKKAFEMGATHVVEIHGDGYKDTLARKSVTERQTNPMLPGWTQHRQHRSLR